MDRNRPAPSAPSDKPLLAATGSAPERHGGLPAATASGDPLPTATLEALRDAFARADINKVELFRSPDMLSGDAFGQLLGVSRATIDNRRVAHKLLALELESKRGYRFPRWQVELVNNRRAAFEAVLQVLAPMGAWQRYRFFVQQSPELEGSTPIEALRAGQFESVVAAARSWAEGEQGGG